MVCTCMSKSKGKDSASARYLAAGVLQVCKYSRRVRGYRPIVPEQGVKDVNGDDPVVVECVGGVRVNHVD